MITIAVANQKGGIGKSTTAAALSEGLTLKGLRALVVDMDPQGSITYIMGDDGTPPTVLEVLRRTARARDAIRTTPQGDILPGNSLLSSADLEFTSIGKEYLLREALAGVATDYDYAILDTPPALGILTINAFTAGDAVIVPAGADILSIQGIEQLSHTINLVKTYCNPKVNIKGLLLTRHNQRTVLSRDFTEAIEEIARGLDTFVYKVWIRDSVVVKEAQARQQGLLAYAPKSAPALDYMAFVEEFLKMERIVE